MAPVHTAAFNGHLEEVQALVGRDPELLKSTASELHRTPLMAAVEGGKLHVVKWLLGHGANLNRYDLAGRTALVVGCSFGHEAVVELLLREGADPNDADAMGWTALMSASFRGHASVVEMLLREGSCDVDALNEKRESPLWLASHQGKEGPVRLLLGAGADPFKPDEDRRTPFDVSATLHAREMIEAWLCTYILRRARSLQDAAIVCASSCSGPRTHGTPETGGVGPCSGCRQAKDSPQGVALGLMKGRRGQRRPLAAVAVHELWPQRLGQGGRVRRAEDDVVRGKDMLDAGVLRHALACKAVVFVELMEHVGS